MDSDKLLQPPTQGITPASPPIPMQIAIWPLVKSTHWRLSTGSEGSNCSPKVLKYTAFYCIFVLQPGTSLSTLLCGASVCSFFHTCLSADLFFKTWSCRVIQDGTHNPLASASEGLVYEHTTTPGSCFMTLYVC